MALIALFAYEGVARDVVKQRDTELAKISAARLSEGLTRHSGILQTAADDDDLQSLEPARMGRALERVQIELFAFDAGVVIYNDQGVAIGSDPFAFNRRGEDFPVRSEFDKVRTTRRSSFSNVFEDAISGEKVILVTVPIVASGNEFKGVLAGMSTLKSLVSNVTYSKVLEITAGRKGFAYLVDGQGQTIYHRDTSRLGESLVVIDPVARATRGETGAVIADDPTGEGVISGFAPVPDTDFSIEWAVVTQDRWKDVVGPIRRASRLMLGLLVLGGVLASALVFFAIGRVLKPVKDLTEGAKRIAGGDFDHTIAARTGDEIQELAQQFNTMAVALKESYAGLEREVAERTEELRESNQTLRTLIQASPLPILALDRDAKVRLWNPAAEATFGWAEDEVIGRALPLVPADEQDQQRADFGRALRGEALAGLEARRQKKDGSPIDVSIWTAPLLDGQGDISGVMGVIADLTERKQAEEEVRLRTQELEALFSVASLLVGPGTLSDKAGDVLEEVARVVGADTVILRLADDEQQGLRLVATAGEGLQDPEPLPLLAYGELLSGEAFEQRRPIIANDYASREITEAARVAHGIKSAIALPIESSGRILGAVEVSSLVADHFTARRVRLLTAIANGMGVLLENADLLERTRESEERYRSLFEHSKEAIFIAGGHQPIEVNQAGLDLLGYTADDVRGLNHEDLWVDPSAMQRMGQELSAKGSVQGFEMKIRRKDGAVIDCAVTMTQYRSADGTLLGEEGIIHDITERKRAEDLFRTLAQSSPVAMYLLQDGKFAFVNSQFERVTGYSADEILGRDFMMLVNPEDRSKVRDSSVKMLKAKTPEPYEYRATSKTGGDAWIMGSLASIEYEGRPATVGTFIDITDRKEAEEALRHSEEEARRLAHESSVMAEIGRVVGSSLDVHEVYGHFAEHVRQLIPFDRIDITLPDVEQGMVAHAYETGLEAPGRSRGDVYPLAGTPTENVVAARSQLLFHLSDSAEVDRQYPSLRPAFDSGLRSFMGTPLISRDQVIGVLFLASTEPNAYSTGHLSMARRVGEQIAGAIANAQLYADRTRAEEEQANLARRLNVLNELMRIAVSNLNVTEVFDGVSEQVKKLIDHDRLSIDLLRAGESSSELYPFVAVGFGAVDRGLSMPLASPVGEVVRTGKPILRSDLLRGGNYPIEAGFATSTGIRSAMFVPLTSRGRVIGCLTFSSVQAGSYDERELDTAQTIADHLAVIVEHAELYEETKRAEEQLRAINNVAISTSSVLQLDDLLPYVTGLLHDTFGWGVVNVLLTDDKNENVVLRATLGQRDEAVAPGFTVDIGKPGIISWVARTGSRC